MGFVPLGKSDENGNDYFEFNGITYNYRIGRRNWPFKECLELKNEREISTEFSSKDFYSILELNIKKYKSMGGLL
jgi:hypothetical protein